MTPPADDDAPPLPPLPLPPAAAPAADGCGDPTPAPVAEDDD
jgi:hypothetical protein